MSSVKRQSRQDLLSALELALREVSGQGVMFSQALAERAGINSTDLECLDVILLKGPLTAGALADATGLTTGAITGVVDRLARAGYAKREHDADDRRKVLVRATESVAKRVLPLTLGMQRETMAVLSNYADKDLALFHDLLVRLRAASQSAIVELRAMKPREQEKRARRK